MEFFYSPLTAELSSIPFLLKKQKSTQLLPENEFLLDRTKPNHHCISLINQGNHKIQMLA